MRGNQEEYGPQVFSLAGTVTLVQGVLNERSIAAAIASGIMACDGDVVLAYYPSDAVEKRVLRFASGKPHIIDALPCDVENEGSLDQLFAELSKLGCTINGYVHSIANSDPRELKGDYLDCTLANFVRTMTVSARSFAEMVKRLRPLARELSAVTLTYEGGERVQAHYNLMGDAKALLNFLVKAIAVDLGKTGGRANAICASPEQTAAAMGITGFNHIGMWAEAMSPLGRRAGMDEIAHAAVFLLSRASRAITGATLPVNCGTELCIMPPLGNIGPILVPGVLKLLKALGGDLEKIRDLAQELLRAT